MITLQQNHVYIHDFGEFFPGPPAFCKKAVERVNSEKNILNSSVECVEWVEWSLLEKVICMHNIRSGSMSLLT